MLIWLGLFFGGLIGHQGTWWVYVVFTAVLTTVLVSGVYRQPSYGYMFLAIFLWLGFWLKLSVHNIFRYDYVEPIGRFNGSLAAWDEVLWVPTMAGMGMLLAHWLHGSMGGKGKLEVTADSARVPLWFPAHRRTLWALLVGSIIALAALNAIYGIQQSGLTPRTILFWPLNAVIYWLLSTGLSMCIATLLWWDICAKKDISLSIYAVFGEAFVSSTSLLSRGLFLFHIVPPLLAIYRNKNHLVWRGHRKFLLAIVISSIFFVVSLSFVSTLRSYLYQPNADFRTTTQNGITRLQVLQALIPAVEQMIALNGTGRLDVLRALIPAVEQLVVLKAMDPAERQLKIKLYKLKPDVPMEDQLQTLALEKIWLERHLSEKKHQAAVTKSPQQIDRHASQQVVFFENQFQDLVLEKARLEQDLSERKKEAALAMGSWIGKSGFLMAEFGYQMTSGLAGRLFALGVDRWIGMEGVMAISSYPQKGNALFLTALTERSGLGEVTLYQKICQSIYQNSDKNKYQFASLPGAAAFFYYTGSLWAVFFGMLFLTLLAIYSEYLVYYLTGNVLLCALVGMNAANAIAQLGVVPRQLLIHFGMLFSAVFIIWLLQSRKRAELTRRR